MHKDKTNTPKHTATHRNNQTSTEAERDTKSVRLIGRMTPTDACTEVGQKANPKMHGTNLAVAPFLGRQVCAPRVRKKEAVLLRPFHC